MTQTRPAQGVEKQTGLARLGSYETVQSLFVSLQEMAQMSGNIKFHGTYVIPVDPMMNEKNHVQSAALEVWWTTRYHFWLVYIKIVLHHYPLQTGHKTLYCCCQDKDKKQKSWPSQREGVKHCDTVGMKRFPCMSSLTVSCCHQQGNRINQHTVAIKLHHLEAHIPYYDVTMPSDAIRVICDDLEWCTPSALVLKICALYPHLTVSQVHFTWTKMNNMNAKNLELYSILGEYNNAGFPLSYCLLSTVTSIEIRKWTRALQNWATCLQNKYHLTPQFIHVNKDMAEISMSQSVWPDMKIQICCQEFTFVNAKFCPLGTSDSTEFKGGTLLEAVPYNDEEVPSLSIQIPSLSQAAAGPLQSPSLSAESATAQSQVFCPTHLHDSIIQMIEQHFCAHPLIPGYCYPSPAGIHQWAVKQMHQFCEENNQPELWAYLWENWYCQGHKIPRLKTTMVMESHWWHVKVDYLYHFLKPWVDLLVWILVMKLALTYHNKLDHILSDTGQFHELSSW
ncbi:hypothetical protein BKA82DRAFT_4329102 [Pisolithus tinctorius]|nr:hypothetical protein BKA82DRAFT_4329102 [Pisolithus tinctorius]